MAMPYSNDMSEPAGAWPAVPGLYGQSTPWSSDGTFGGQVWPSGDHDPPMLVVAGANSLPAPSGAGGRRATSRFGRLVGLVAVAIKAVALGAKSLTFLSMIVSVAAYSLFWGFPFAVGLVLLLLVHELGHYAALRRYGHQSTAPMFLPFLGAVIGMKRPPMSAVQEAVFALAGPVAGAGGSIVVLMWAHLGASQLLTGLAYSGFLLNLFNLLPVLPFDGGRVAGAISPKIWIAGVVLSVLLFAAFPSPVLLLMILFALFATTKRYKQFRSGAEGNYYAVPGRTRAVIAGAYVGMIIVCSAGMAITYIASLKP